MPKVSIILAVYNVEQYLPRCLDSIVNQTLSDIEIICVNDCSMDKSLQVLMEYANKDRRIRIINLTENKGAAVARNEGLKIANGEYLAFVDPDDYVDLDFYEKLYNLAILNNLDIAKGEIKNFEIDGTITKDNLNERIREKNNKFLFTYSWTTAIYKKNMITKNSIFFPAECRKGQDIVFLFRCVLNSNDVGLVDNTFYNYVRRDSSLDIGILDTNKVISNVNAVKIILKELNSSNLYEIESDLYISTFIMHFNSFLYPAFKNNTEEAKKICAENMIKMYYSCRDVKMLNKCYDLLLLQSFILQKDVNGLTNELEKYQSRNKLISSNILYKLRQNIKK